MYPDMYEFNEFASTFGDVDSAIVAITAVVMVVYLLMFAFSIVSYVLGSLGMYSIAKRRGIHHAWMSWLPVCNMWILGSISDQYQYVTKAKVRNRRKVLLGLTIATYALLILIFIAFFVFGFTAVLSESTVSDGMWGAIALILVSYLAMFVVAIILTVFEFIAYYDLFASCKPDNAVAFLVLGIFFTFLLPFFVFACRKKDLGMPPRRPQTPVAPPPVWQEPDVPVQQTWQPAPLPTAEAEAPAVEEALEIPVQEEQPPEEPEE